MSEQNDIAWLQRQLKKYQDKYKKALEQIMNILKVNRSLKKIVDQNKLSQQQNTNENKQITITDKRIQSAIQQNNLKHQQTIKLQASEISNLSQKVNTLVHEKKILQQKYKILSAQQLRNNKEMDFIKIQENKDKVNKSLIERLPPKPPLKSLTQRTDIYQRQVVRVTNSEQSINLKDKIENLQMEILKLKQNHRVEILSWQNRLTSQKFQIMKQKDQLNSIINNLRLQIQKLRFGHMKNQDENLVHQEFHFQELEKKVRELMKSITQVPKQEKMSQKKSEIDFQTQYNLLLAQNQRLKQKLIEFDTIKNRLNSIEKQIHIITKERDNLVQKVHIFQALRLTQPHKQYDQNQLLLQFQSRIDLLIQDEKKKGFNSSNSIYQGVVLKSCIKQLNQLLIISKSKIEELENKNQKLKRKLLKSQTSFKNKIESYRNRITSFDALVNKLYRLLEEKYNEFIPKQIQREFETAISHYELKLIELSEQIILLKRKKQDESMENCLITNMKLEEQIKYLSEKNKLLQMDILKSKTENEQLSKNLEEKLNTIETLQKTIARTEINMEIQLKDRQRYTEILQNNFQKEIQQLRSQLDTHRIINKNLSKNQTQKAVLIQKITLLERELFEAKKLSQFQSGINFSIESIEKLQKNIVEQENKIYILNSQIIRLNEIISHLKNQNLQLVQLEKNQKIAISSLKTEKVKLSQHFKQTELLMRDEVDFLRNQNRELTQQLSSKHAQMMDYYDQLSRKSQEIEENNKIIDLQKELKEQKDHNLIFEAKIQKIQRQLAESNSQITNLRTNILTLKKEIQSKQDQMNEIKHNYFTLQMKYQKVNSELKIYESKGNLMTFVLLVCQIESLRQKLLLKEKQIQIERIKHQQIIKLMETKHTTLSHSFLLSSEINSQINSKMLINPRETSLKSENSLYDQLSQLNSEKLGEGQKEKLKLQSKIKVRKI